MPAAHGGATKKYWLMDHDPAYIDVSPPVQNTWYEVYHAYDVRQLFMSILYYDDEETGASFEVRWTCDGNIYIIQDTIENDTQEYIYKNKLPSGGNDELSVDREPSEGRMPYRDKRAQDFKVEIRITSAIGTNAHLIGHALYETLEET